MKQPQPAITPAPKASTSAETSTAKPVKKKRKVLAISPDGKKIKVHRLTSGNTPYRGQYSELDEWIWDNYDPGEEDWAIQGKGIEQGKTLRALYVNEDGYVIPNLEALLFELEQRKQGKPYGAKPGPYALYAIGVLPDQIRLQNQSQRVELTAGYMPEIPLWLSANAPHWSLILPDGSVVFKGTQGKGGHYYPTLENMHDLDEMKVSHYDAKGMFIDQTEPGQFWCELYFTEFEEALKRHEIGRDNVKEYGFYLQFLNLVDKEKTGYYYYDGTPLSLSEVRSKPDYNNLFVMYGKYVTQMYIQQRKKQR